MNFYIAARFNQWERAKEVRELVRATGHEVRSKWIDRAPITHHHLSHRGAALEDLEDINACGGLILVTNNTLAGYTTGGSHTEFGYALAKGKELVIYGERENVFHHLSQVTVCADTTALVRYLVGKK